VSKKKLRSDMGWSTRDRIVVRGKDLVTELLGQASLGEVAFLELKGRLPTAGESAVFDAVVVALVEHGMTPSAIATRMTYLGAPESLQGAVAAGLLGLGDRYGGSVEGVARMLQEAVESGGDARSILDGFRKKKEPLPGLGHPIHKPIDPRTPKLFEIAAANHLSGRYVSLMEEVAREASSAYKRDLPVNATGAIGAILSELELPWRVTRGVAVMARAIGLVGHLQEELAEPLADEIWRRVDDESSEHNQGR
jgi:citrate synthase